MSRKNYIVTIGDIHFGASDDKRLYDELQKNFIPFVKSKILDKQLDVINFAGDLYHRVINFNEEGGRLVLQFMEEVLSIAKEKNIPVNIIRGTKSHDYAQLNMLKRFEADYPNFHIINTFEVLDVITPSGDKIHTLFLPEEYPTNIEEYYKDVTGPDVEEKSYDMIIGHGMMNYVFNMDYKSNFEMDIRSAPTWDADNLIRLTNGPVEFGHVHNQEIYKDQVYYTRSFSRFSFGDKGSKGFLFTELSYDDNNDVIDFTVEEEINLDAPSFVTINIDELHLESDEEKLKYINEIKRQNDHVHVTSNDKQEASLLKQVTENDSSIKIAVKDKKLEEREIDPDLKYLIEGKGSTEENILQFIKTNMGDEHVNSEINLQMIRDIVNPKKDISYKEILELSQSK